MSRTELLYPLAHALFEGALLFWASWTVVTIVGFALLMARSDRILGVSLLMASLLILSWAILGEADIFVLPWAVFSIVVALPSPYHKGVLESIALLLGVLSLYCIAIFCLGLPQFTSPVVGRRLSGGYGTPDFYYPIFMIGCGLAWMGPRLRFGPIFAISVGLSCGIALILTYSRAGYLGAASLAFLDAIVIVRGRGDKLPRGKRLYRSALSVLVAGAFLTAALVVRGAGPSPNLTTDRSAASRILMWESSVVAIQKRPLFGSGPWSMYRGTGVVDLTRIKSPPVTLPFDAKNLWLDITVRFGAVGLIAFTSFLRAVMQKRLEVQRLLLICLPATLVDTPFWGAPDRLVPTLVLLVCLGILYRQPPEISKKHGSDEHADRVTCPAFSG